MHIKSSSSIQPAVPTWKTGSFMGVCQRWGKRCKWTRGSLLLDGESYARGESAPSCPPRLSQCRPLEGHGIMSLRMCAGNVNPSAACPSCVGGVCSLCRRSSMLALPPFARFSLETHHVVKGAQLAKKLNDAKWLHGVCWTPARFRLHDQDIAALLKDQYPTMFQRQDLISS